MDYDVVIIGGGPAGLTAGIYCVRRGLKALVVERGSLGGKVLMASEIENWPGDRHVTGEELSKRMSDHAKGLGVEFVYNEAIMLGLAGDVKNVTLRDRELSCKAVILATGGQTVKASVKGEEEFSGRGVSYCATCDGPLFKGKAVAVVGGGNMAVEDAVYIDDLSSKTYLVADEIKAEESLQERLKKSGVEVLEDSLSEIVGSEFVEGVRLKSGKDLEVNGVFICQGSTPSTELAKQSGVELDERSFIGVNRDMETNIPGVYAAGDVTGGVPQIATAVGEGATAALRAYVHVKQG
ncbi:MAG: FAD-binding protein [Candidatus Altiarchaeales archaeon]|nr:FAD-binding protein [Candidatus Altiarchaeales archaeon]MBD3416494.1 FAD-binding protein [Candidatus Altiarchaeales archaeon]